MLLLYIIVVLQIKRWKIWIPLELWSFINYMQINTDAIILIIAENNYIHNIVNRNIIINVVFL